MKCSCGKEVEPEREGLGLNTCYACALNVPKLKGVMVVDGKSFVDILIVTEKQHSQLVPVHRLSGNQSAPR